MQAADRLAFSGIGFIVLNEANVRKVRLVFPLGVGFEEISAIILEAGGRKDLYVFNFCNGNFHALRLLKALVHAYLVLPEPATLPNHFMRLIRKAWPPDMVKAGCGRVAEILRQLGYSVLIPPPTFHLRQEVRGKTICVIWLIAFCGINLGDDFSTAHHTSSR